MAFNFLVGFTILSLIIIFFCLWYQVTIPKKSGVDSILCRASKLESHNWIPFESYPESYFMEPYRCVGTLSLTVIVVGNRVKDSSSNHVQRCLQFTFC